MQHGWQSPLFGASFDWQGLWQLAQELTSSHYGCSVFASEISRNAACRNHLDMAIMEVAQFAFAAVPVLSNKKSATLIDLSSTTQNHLF